MRVDDSKIWRAHSTYLYTCTYTFRAPVMMNLFKKPQETFSKTNPRIKDDRSSSDIFCSIRVAGEPQGHVLCLRTNATHCSSNMSPHHYNLNKRGSKKAASSKGSSCRPSVLPLTSIPTRKRWGGMTIGKNFRKFRRLRALKIIGVWLSSWNVACTNHDVHKGTAIKFLAAKKAWSVSKIPVECRGKCIHWLGKTLGSSEVLS